MKHINELPSKLSSRSFRFFQLILFVTIVAILFTISTVPTFSKNPPVTPSIPTNTPNSNTSTDPLWRTYSDTAPELQYSKGNWQRASVPEAMGGDLTYSGDANARLTLIFKGTAIRIIYSSGVDGGSFTIQLDDSSVQLVNSKNNTPVYEHQATLDNLNNGDHQLVLTNLGSGLIRLEAIQVRGQLALTKLQGDESLNQTLNKNFTAAALIPVPLDVTLTQDFEDSIIVPNELDAQLNKAISGPNATVGDPNDILFTTVDFTKRAYVYTSAQSQPTPLNLEVDSILSDNPASGLTVTSVELKLTGAIRGIAPLPQQTSNDIWADLITNTGEISSIHCVLNVSQDRMCPELRLSDNPLIVRLTFPSQEVTNVKSVRFHFTATAPNGYLYLIGLDDVTVRTLQSTTKVCGWGGTYDQLLDTCTYHFGSDERIKASNYALTFANGTCSLFCAFQYSALGGESCADPSQTDCANFISQALFYGGLPMTTNWFCKNTEINGKTICLRGNGSEIPGKSGRAGWAGAWRSAYGGGLPAYIAENLQGPDTFLLQSQREDLNFLQSHPKAPFKTDNGNATITPYMKQLWDTLTLPEIGIGQGDVLYTKNSAVSPPFYHVVVIIGWGPYVETWQQLAQVKSTDIKPTRENSNLVPYVVDHGPQGIYGFNHPSNIYSEQIKGAKPYYAISWPAFPDDKFNYVGGAWNFTKIPDTITIPFDDVVVPDNTADLKTTMLSVCPVAIP